MKRTKWIGLITTVVFVCSVGGSVAVANQFRGFPVVRLLINGKELPGVVPPIVIEGRTMLPVRDVAEAFGATVAWDEATQTVSLTGELPQTLKQENQTLQARIAALEAENASLKVKMASPPLASQLQPVTRTLMPAGVKEAPLEYTELVGSRTLRLPNWFYRFALYTDGDQLYMNTDAVKTIFSLALNVDVPLADVPLESGGIMYRTTNVLIDEKNPDSPWYSLVELRNDRNGKQVAYDTRGTAFQHAEHKIPVPFSLQELAVQLGVDWTVSYDQNTKILTLRRN